MKAQSHRNDDKVKAWLRLSGNPYASLALFGEEEAKETTEFDQKRVYFRKLQNPHAHSAVFGEPADDSAKAELSLIDLGHEPRGTVSKRAFQETCRRIFLQYIPPTEGRGLRPHYRDFILRNQDSSASNRFRILEDLRKYDLSPDGAFQPHFNRGQEIFTEKKLKQIERGN